MILFSYLSEQMFAERTMPRLASGFVAVLPSGCPAPNRDLVRLCLAGGLSYRRLMT